MGANQVYGNAYNTMGVNTINGYGEQSFIQNNNNKHISCIIPPINGIGGLYLGDYRAASNYQILQNYGIKGVLTSAKQANLHYDHSIIPYHLVVNARDCSSFNLVQYFDQAVDFTRRALSRTNVLIHCMAGVSRSATLTIAYLMSERGMSYQNAFSIVQHCRPVINPNNGFKLQLKQYELILSQRRGMNARKSMAYAGSPRNMNITFGTPQYDLMSMNQFKFSGVKEGF